MIPLRDSTHSLTFPIVNVGLIILNTLAFFYQLSLGRQVDGLYQALALIPAKIYYLATNQPGDVVGIGVPFFSSIFLHGGWMHFIGNMWFLWIFGDNVEDSMGHGRYILFYLLAGLGAGIVHLLLNAESQLPTIGASGAISGVMGAYLVLYPRGRVLTLLPIFIFFKIIDIPAYFFLIFWILIQAVQGVIALGLPADVGGVAWWAHIGGFVIGAALIFLFRKRPPPEMPSYY